jgi:hypothetical protein
MKHFPLLQVHKMWQRRIYKLKIELKIVSIIQVFRGNLPVNIFLMDDCWLEENNLKIPRFDQILSKPGFPMPYVVIFFAFNFVRWEMVVHFIDIDEI